MDRRLPFVNLFQGNLLLTWAAVVYTSVCALPLVGHSRPPSIEQYFFVVIAALAGLGLFVITQIARRRGQPYAYSWNSEVLRFEKNGHVQWEIAWLDLDECERRVQSHKVYRFKLKDGTIREAPGLIGGIYAVDASSAFDRMLWNARLMAGSRTTPCPGIDTWPLSNYLDYGPLPLTDDKPIVFKRIGKRPDGKTDESEIGVLGAFFSAIIFLFAFASWGFDVMQEHTRKSQDAPVFVAIGIVGACVFVSVIALSGMLLYHLISSRKWRDSELVIEGDRIELNHGGATKPVDSFRRKRGVLRDFVEIGADGKKAILKAGGFAQVKRDI